MSNDASAAIDRLVSQGLAWKERAEIAEQQRGELYGEVAQLKSDLNAAKDEIHKWAVKYAELASN